MTVTLARTALALLSALFLIGASGLRLEINAAGGSGLSGGLIGIAWILIAVGMYLAMVAMGTGRQT